MLAEGITSQRRCRFGSSEATKIYKIIRVIRFETFNFLFAENQQVTKGAKRLFVRFLFKNCIRRISKAIFWLNVLCKFRTLRILFDKTLRFWIPGKVSLQHLPY